MATQVAARANGLDARSPSAAIERIRTLCCERLGEKVPAAMVWAAVLILAAGNSVVRALAELGAHHQVDGRNPITPCNVLLVGSFCAFLVLSAVHWRSWTRDSLRALGRRDWLSMIGSGVLSSSLGPAFTLLALENTSVTNLVLIGRLEPLLFLLLSAVVLGQAIDRFALVGLLFAVAGAALAFVLQNGGALPTLGRGEAYAALAAASFAGSTLVSRIALVRAPLGIFIVFRTGLAVIVFFWTAVYLYGFQHFAGVRSAFLWQTMALYGTLFVVLAQLCWFAGMRRVRPAEISLASAFSPLAGIIFALAILGETPTIALAAGGAAILMGVIIGRLGPSVRDRLCAGRWRIGRRSAPRD